jgi:hypothetical protein
VTAREITFTADPVGLERLAQQVAAILEQRGLDAPARRFLSKEALAEHLGISVRQVRGLREKGLPGRKHGKLVLFDVDEVADWIDREGM